MRIRTIGVLAVALTIGVGSSACSKTEESATGPATTGQVGTTATGAGSSGTTTAKSGTTMAPGAKTPTISAASELRTTLTQLLNTHTILAANATGAALGGRSEEFDAAAAQLDANTKAITDAIVSIYGPDAELFGDGWKAHIGFFVNYTQAAAKGDAAGKEKAAKDLDGYAGDLAAFLANANPNLPKDTVAELVRGHIKTLLAVIDAQAAKDYATAYNKLGEAVAHMHEIADPLASAIAKQFPDKFSGDPLSKAADLQALLVSALQQHTAYAAMATNAAIGGRTAEYDAAVGLLGQNTQAIIDAVVGVYGPDAAVFGDGWKAHIGFFVNYTEAAAKSDAAAKEKAAKDLDGYAGDLAAFLANANPNLPKDTVVELVRGHIKTLLAVIDAQAAKDYSKQYRAYAEAMDHMHEIGDPLAGAIAKQFPEKFPIS